MSGLFIIMLYAACLFAVCSLYIVFIVFRLIRLYCDGTETGNIRRGYNLHQPGESRRESEDYPLEIRNTTD